MYLHLGQSVMVPYDSIIGLFDLDNSTWSFRTRGFLDQMEEKGKVFAVGDDLPRSFILCQEEGRPAEVYISQLTTATLLRRAESGSFYDL